MLILWHVSLVWKQMGFSQMSWNVTNVFGLGVRYESLRFIFWRLSVQKFMQSNFRLEQSNVDIPRHIIVTYLVSKMLQQYCTLLWVWQRLQQLFLFNPFWRPCWSQKNPRRETHSYSKSSNWKSQIPVTLQPRLSGSYVFIQIKLYE